MASSKKSDAKKKTDTKPTEVEKETSVETPDDAKAEPEKVEETEATAEPTEEVAEDSNPVDADTQTTADAPPPVVVERKGGFFPLLLGGVVAAGAGFGVSQYLSDEWPFGAGQGDETATLQAAVDEQAEQIDALTLAVEAASDSSSVDAGFADVQQTLETLRSETTEKVETLSTRLQGFEERLNEVEKRPISEGAAGSAALAAYERELEAMRAALEEQRAQIEGISESATAQIASAEGTANAATARAAMSRVHSALTTGGSFADALEDVRASVNVDIPEVLAANADSGVPTLADLQRSFPDAARAAIEAEAEAGVLDGSTSRIGAFLQSQLGARSLSPREGADADAVLSRAEAALRDGQLETALAEVETLQEVSRAEMADWIDAAKTRDAALIAAAELTDTLSSN
ncbi:COG4223 family protein [Aliiroseovarius sp. YM-037]|uniref:COG4223 family protein n=1 Tax=Aliiroseovarius sp. YM-037 TaxID=3341728 RepID=UPI003A8060D4